MELGAMISATDYTIAADELARELEARGYESLFVPEHTHIPASRQSPWPGVYAGRKPRLFAAAQSGVKIRPLLRLLN